MASYIEVPETDVEPLATVLATLRLQRIAENRYLGHNLPQFSGRIYGGQVLAQATMAAADTLPIDDDRHILLGAPSDFPRYLLHGHKECGIPKEHPREY